jgi:hypothetical protein
VAAMVGSVSPTAMGFITTSTPVPTTAITTFPWGGSAWSAWAGSGVVALSGGAVTAAAYLADAGSTHVIVDVSGFFVPADLGGQSYVPLVPPARFLDTRTTNDPLPAATERVYQTAGFGGLPATATALALSATVVVPQSYGYLNLYAADRGFPLTSFLNYLAGDVIANGGIVAVSGTTGRLAAWSVQGVHLTLDVHGAFVPETARRYYPIEPCRVLDTRVTGQRFSGSLTFAVGGTCGIPADAAAVAADFAVVNPSLFGYLALSPAGYTAYVSQLLYRPGWTISSGALVSLGTGGGVTVQSGGGGTTDFVFDVTGYFR